MKLFLCFLFFVSSLLQIKAQKTNILEVNDLKRLENYLKNTRSKDEHLLKKLNKKLARLKQEATLQKIREELKKKQAQAAAEAQKKIQQINKENIKENIKELFSDKKTFDSLMTLKSVNNNEKTTKHLNIFFENDLSSTNTTLLINNQSKCNLVLHIDGEKSYIMAIPLGKKDVITVKKGNYKLSGKLCEKTYSSNKILSKNISITLQ